MNNEKVIDIYLVRHGETSANKKGLVCGQMDVLLTEEGISQATKLRDAIRSNLNVEFDNCYSSTLKRAKQTAEIIVGDSLDIIEVDDLKEMSGGDYEHLTVQELIELDQRFSDLGSFNNLSYPNGESLEIVYNRCSRWIMNEIISKNRWGSHLIVGHWGSMNLLLHYLLSIPLNKYPAFYSHNCQLTHIKIFEHMRHAPQLHRMNFS